MEELRYGDIVFVTEYDDKIYLETYKSHCGKVGQIISFNQDPTFKCATVIFNDKKCYNIRIERLIKIG